jgi:hypothetical protein
MNVLIISSLHRAKNVSIGLYLAKSDNEPIFPQVQLTLRHQTQPLATMLGDRIEREQIQREKERQAFAKTVFRNLRSSEYHKVAADPAVLALPLGLTLKK